MRHIEEDRQYWFSADAHLDHTNIIKFCNRPFKDVNEMNNEIIDAHNSVVGKNDFVVVVGDFSFANKKRTCEDFIDNMNGSFIFLRGDHDKWMGKTGYGFHEIWKKKIKEHYIVCCHYPMYSWPRSHYGSFLLHGHHHGRRSFQNKSIDVGVDTNNFYPYSLDQVIAKMKTKPDTPGLIKNIFNRG